VQLGSLYRDPARASKGQKISRGHQAKPGVLLAELLRSVGCEELNGHSGAGILAGTVVGSEQCIIRREPPALARAQAWPRRACRCT
jgi:hypothetical protein